MAWYSVETLKIKRRVAKNSRKTSEKRRDGVQKAYQSGSRIDCDYSKIRREVGYCASELSSGIKGLSPIVTPKCDSITEKMESQCRSFQTSFSEALQFLAREVNRCQGDVDDYNNKIADYERQIKEQGGIILPWE